MPTQLQSAVGVDRQLPHNITLSVNYLNTRGTHILQTFNINTPFPGTYIPPLGSTAAQGLYPFGQAAGIINQYSGSGVYQQNQLVVNANVRLNTRVSVFGYYVYGHVSTDANGSPSNPYNIAQDYGRAGYDFRHQVNINGSIMAPFGIRFSPNIGLRSAGPYNLVSGLDNLGTTSFNQRPAFLPAGSNIAACGPKVVAGGAPCVEHGFVLNPTQGMNIIPVNYGKAFPQYQRQSAHQQDLGLRRIDAVGAQPSAAARRRPAVVVLASVRRQARVVDVAAAVAVVRAAVAGGMPGMGGGDSSGRRFSLTASIMFHNMFNTVNPAAPIGNLLSPSYGEAIAQASGGAFGGGGAAQAFNRRIDLSLRFSF